MVGQPCCLCVFPCSSMSMVQMVNRLQGLCFTTENPMKTSIGWWNHQVAWFKNLGWIVQKKKCPLKRGLNNDQPEDMGTWFPANPSENRNVISHFSKNCIFIGVPSSWIMIIPSIVGSIIPKLIIGQQQFIYPLWLLALPDEFGSKDGGVADILGCHWMVSVPISLGNFNSEKW